MGRTLRKYSDNHHGSFRRDLHHDIVRFVQELERTLCNLEGLMNFATHPGYTHFTEAQWEQYISPLEQEITKTNLMLVTKNVFNSGINYMGHFQAMLTVGAAVTNTER